jgi:hypothetical protein
VQPAEGGEQSPPFGKLEKKPMELAILAEGFARIFMTFAPFGVAGLVVMWITTRK